MPYNIINPKRVAASKRNAAKRSPEAQSTAVGEAKLRLNYGEAAHAAYVLMREGNPTKFYSDAIITGQTCQCGLDRSSFPTKSEFKTHLAICHAE